MIGVEQHLAGLGIDDGLGREAAVDVLAEGVDILVVLRILGIERTGVAAAVDRRGGHALGRAAVRPRG